MTLVDQIFTSLNRQHKACKRDGWRPRHGVYPLRCQPRQQNGQSPIIGGHLPDVCCEDIRAFSALIVPGPSGLVLQTYRSHQAARAGDRQHPCRIQLRRVETIELIRYDQLARTGGSVL